MTIIGCNDMKPVEVITQSSDDISIDGAHRVDCIYKAKAMHFWSNHKRFEVSHALSSITIKMIAK